MSRYAVELRSNGHPIAGPLAGRWTMNNTTQAEAATPKQLKYLDDLIDQRDVKIEAAEIIVAAKPHMTKKEAGAVIDYLLSLPITWAHFERQMGAHLGNALEVG